MLIRALAAAISSGSLLALLPLWVSVTLSGILSLALLFFALSAGRQKAELFVLALVAILMTWRGEAWKTVFLQSQQQVSELLQQQQQRISSNAGFLSLGRLPRHAESRFVSLCDATQFHAAIIPFEHHKPLAPMLSIPASHGDREVCCSILPSDSGSDRRVYLAQSGFLSIQTDYMRLGDPQQGIQTDGQSNFHTNAGPTPTDFI